MPSMKHTPQEVESRGEAIYAHPLRDHVETEHRGKYLVLDIESGDYEIDKDDLSATKQLLLRRQNLKLAPMPSQRIVS